MAGHIFQPQKGEIVEVVTAAERVKERSGTEKAL